MMTRSFGSYFDPETLCVEYLICEYMNYQQLGQDIDYKQVKSRKNSTFNLGYFSCLLYVYLPEVKDSLLTNFIKVNPK